MVRPENYALDRDERNAACVQIGLPIDTPLTLASEFKVAQTVGADWAVVGDFNITEQRLTVHAQLLDVRQLKLSQPIELSGDLTDLVDLQTRLAWRLLATHDPSFTVGSEDDFRKRFHDIRLDAFENYIRGLVAADDASLLHFFTEADRLDPSDHRAAFALGRYYFGQKDYANSAKWLHKEEAADPDYDEALFLEGVDELFLGHQATSEKEFETLAKELPLNEVSNNLGVLEARRGRYAEALANFEQAYQSDPADPDFCFNRGVVLWDEKRYPEAAESLAAAIRLDADDFEAHTLLAVVLGKMGDTEGEKREMDWLAEHQVGPDPDQPSDVLPQPRIKKNYNGRAFRLLQLTMNNALEARLEGASPQAHSDAHLALGEKYVSEKRYVEAEHEFSEVTSLTPADPQGHILLAQALEAEGKHENAAQELQIALKLKDSAEAHLALARVYISLNQPALAKTQGQAALALDPGSQEAQQLLHQIHAGPATSRKTP
jgi:tetratricopeptide (TPR) repeat protein